jgi:mono/diheme cytochrome c family protein
MRARPLILLATGVLAVVLPAAALAQARTDLGRFEYDNNCASCHGALARGDGEVGRTLKQPVPDLTTLASRNGGVFPAERVRRVIDGRDALKGHWGRAMPLWGLQYSSQAAEFYKGLAIDPEAFVRQRVDALVEHLRTLQGPPQSAKK